MPACRGSGGFTLLELLIALAIFGLLSVMSYSGLKSVMDQQARTEEAAERMAELQKIYLLMQRDLEQVVPRPVRDEYGDAQPALAGGDVLQFTRGGWSNPLQSPRSNLQRVGYALADGRLVRYTWRVLDRAQDSLPLEQALTDAVAGMSIRYLSADNEWVTGWPVSTGSAGGGAGTGGLVSLLAPAAPAVDLPRAVEVTLEHDFYGEIAWLFRLPQ